MEIWSLSIKNKNNRWTIRRWAIIYTAQIVITEGSFRSY
jgi:hypothetical protein